MPREFPTPDEELELHRRLTDGDPTASSDLAIAYVDYLVDWLRERNSARIDDHLIGEAASDAIVSLIKTPGSYNPDSKRSLISYLQMSASADLKNCLKKRERQSRNEIPLNSVEQSMDRGIQLCEDDDPLEQLITREEADIIKESQLPELRDGLSPQEIECLELLLDEERSTRPYARALKIEHLPDEEQRRRVKQVKDKLQNRIKRGRSRHEAHLESLAKRLESDPSFLACALRSFATSQKLDEAGLASTLGCSPETLTALRLCRMPRDDHFKEDMDTIARRFNIDRNTLASATRHGQVTLRMRGDTPADRGFVLAARDDENETDEPQENRP